ncbi:unnamed protein product [Triticum turgidum subsp. durum]|uniref:Uncharacterized protein n=1 Tax=Triticum turgidum subsp. durum TaxID=4567 RepID=A0A9R1RZF8_TRITD|nr:unnamed protein product [Triticum turgidum subsp. durum]
MGKRASSKAGKKAAVAGAGANDRKERRDETEAQKVERLQATLAFVKAAHADAMLYLDMEEEYRRAGRLHTYDQDNEWKKRLARVAKLYPPPKHIMEEISEYTKYLEEDEDDFRIGLCQLIEVKSDFEKSF